jgi:hypothetical protein
VDALAKTPLDVSIQISEIRERSLKDARYKTKVS